MLAVEGLCKNFANLAALDGVDLSVAPGVVTGLIGPNGSGKTTLINVVTGALPPSGGRVVLDGRDIGCLPTNRRVGLGLGRTFQNVRLWPRLTVSEHLWVAGGKGAKGRGHLADLLAFADLSARRDDLAGNLSLGEQRRLELARALATEPKVLLLDEPVAGLTADEIAAFLERLLAMRDQGTAILLVEHNVDVVMRVTDRLVVLNFGRKIADGAPADVRRDPLVQEAYLGSPRSGR